MNKAPLVFLGILFTLSLSWWGMVYRPAIQLGGETPDNGDGTALKPRVGLARQGEQVYQWFLTTDPVCREVFIRFANFLTGMSWSRKWATVRQVK